MGAALHVMGVTYCLDAVGRTEPGKRTCSVRHSHRGWIPHLKSRRSNFSRKSNMAWRTLSGRGRERLGGWGRGTGEEILLVVRALMKINCFEIHQEQILFHSQIH